MQDQPGARSSLAAAISDIAVSKLRQHVGRGATEARAIVDGDVVTVVMRDVLTKGERLLAEGGDAEAVLTFRRAFQAAMGGETSDEVARITGRAVVASMSANTVDPDYCVQVFILGPPIGATGAPARLDGHGPVDGIGHLDGGSPARETD